MKKLTILEIISPKLRAESNIENSIFIYLFVN